MKPTLTLVALQTQVSDFVVCCCLCYHYYCATVPKADFVFEIQHWIAWIQCPI